VANGIGRKTLYSGGLTKVRGEVKAVYPIDGSRKTDLSDVSTVAIALTTKGVLHLIAILATSLVMSKGRTVTITGHRFKNVVTVTAPKGE
jgi:hypothetical protein